MKAPRIPAPHENCPCNPNPCWQLWRMYFRIDEQQQPHSAADWRCMHCKAIKRAGGKAAREAIDPARKAAEGGGTNA
jgi:hypothetical protein